MRPVGYAALLSRFGVPDMGLVHAPRVSAAGGMVERHDRAAEGVRAVREMPDRRERLFIQCEVQNKGRLSKGKRLLFAELPDEELARMESAVRDAFALDDSTSG